MIGLKGPLGSDCRFRGRAPIYAIGLGLLAFGLPSRIQAADRVELVDGTRISGKVISETDKSVSIVMQRGGVTMTIPLKRIHAIKTQAGRRVINPKKTRFRSAPRVSWRPRIKRKPTKPKVAVPAYKTQKWPAAQQLVWANPGKGGDFRDAKNWRPNKRPDKNTDLLLPAAEKPYIIRARRGCYGRHVTIEKNAAIIAAHGGGPFTVWGNCWVKEGGRVHFVDVVGPKHTFFRLDGGEWGKYKFSAGGLSDPWNQTPSSHIHHKMQITKFDGGSVEFIGNVGIGDEFYLSRGRMIVSGEFRYNGAAGKGTFEVFDGATLELQSGGTVAPHKPGSRMNIFNISVYTGGTLQAGSPERPLTKDAYLLLGFQGKPNSGHTGLYCAKGSKIRVYSSDPKKARLVIGAVEHTGTPSANGDRQGVEVHLAGDVQFDGVVFDCFRQGGIRLLDTNQPKSWTHTFYGPRNAAGPAGLFASLVVKPDTYYHNRVYMRFGRVLEGLKIMQKATGQRLEIEYPTSGKIFTHGGINKRVRWAPGAKKKEN